MRRPIGSQEAAVLSGTILVSVLNYAFTLALIHVMRTGEYAIVGSVSSLLLICGSVSGASMPWVLAREVVLSGQDKRRLERAVSFCLVATTVQGLLVGLAAALVISQYAGIGVVFAEVCSVVVIFFAATIVGYMQGRRMFRRIVVLRVAEVIIKMSVGLTLVEAGFGPAGAIGAFAVGAAVVAAGGALTAKPRGSRLDLRVLFNRRLWGNAGGLFVIQTNVAIVATIDIIVASVVLGATTAVASYQAAQVVARIPLFVAGALSTLVYPYMVKAGDKGGDIVEAVVGGYAVIGSVLMIAIITCPGSIVHLVFPSRYTGITSLLPVEAVGGLAIGFVELLSTVFQATENFKRISWILSVSIAGMVVVESFTVARDGVLALAIMVAAGTGVVALVMFIEAMRTFTFSALRLPGLGLFALLLGLPMILLSGHPVAWFVAAVGAGLVAGRFGLRYVARMRIPVDGGGVRRPRVLHLGYEDPKRPGSGGGSIRTHEINSRLATAFDVTVYCAAYRGCRPRVEDGVQYRHVGLARGYWIGLLSYFAAIPFVVMASTADLIIEDFGAPFSSVAVPLFTRRPVIGSVQWLFAHEKSKQYHLPFHWVQAIGIASHQEFIAVSSDLGRTLSTTNDSARVHVIGNGVDLTPGVGVGDRDFGKGGIRYLGRLEVAQKGLDMLLEAYAAIADDISQDLIIGGDGPDGAVLMEQARRAGLADRVRFVGRVSAAERLSFLAGADVVAIPSRYETFGMVAAESLAAGSPVVAFDIPCLRALVDESVGASVAAFDVSEFGATLRRLCQDPDLRRSLGEAGPAQVADLNWDRLAEMQGKVYRDTLSRAGSHEREVEVCHA